MKTVRERILENKLDGIPQDIVLRIGDEIDKLVKNEGQELKAAIFIATARTVKAVAGMPPANNRGEWFDACIGIGEEVYSMCIKRYPEAETDMVQKQALAGAYRGTVDKTIEKLASIKAKNYAIDE